MLQDEFKALIGFLLTTDTFSVEKAAAVTIGVHGFRAIIFHLCLAADAEHDDDLINRLKALEDSINISD